MVEFFDGYKTYIGVTIIAALSALVGFSETDSITYQTNWVYFLNAIGLWLAGMGAAGKLSKIQASNMKISEKLDR